MKEAYLIACRPSKNAYDKNRRYLFLGEWSISYKESNLPKNYEILPYHWNDRAKFIKDCEYLDDIYEQYLSKVADRLNHEHKTNHSVLYWRVLIGPWLGEFIQILYDRWSTIQIALANYEIKGISAMEGELEEFIPNDMIDFQRRYVEDDWNEMIFGCLLKSANISIDFKKSEERKKGISKSFGGDLKRQTKRIVNFISGLIGGRSKYFLIQTYLSAQDQISLQLTLGQTPAFWYSPEPPANSHKKLSKLRLSSNNLRLSLFEEVLSGLLFKNIPLIYLEGYERLNNLVDRLNWPKNPKIIFTSNSFISDDVFKAWAARKITKGSKLVIGQHGGGYGMMKYFFHEKHQLKIADHFLTWGWEKQGEGSTISAGIFIKGVDKKYSSKSANQILFIECAASRYSSHLACTFISSQWLCYFENLTTFYACLSKSTQECVSLRLYPNDYGWKRRQRWLDLFSNIRLGVNNEPLLKAIQRSKLCVCTYNGTTYLQCLAMNVPTIVFWDPKNWEVCDFGEECLESLKEAGIFHANPKAAAEHLERVWVNVDGWWLSKAVQTARTKFCEQYANTSKNHNKIIKELFEKN